MRLLLASGCLPERAGQAAQVQLHLTLDELMDMPGAPDAASAWLARHLAASRPGDDGRPGDAQPGTAQPAGGTSLADAPAGHPDTSQPGGPTASRRDDASPADTPARTPTDPAQASPAQAASPAAARPRPGPTSTS